MLQITQSMDRFLPMRHPRILLLSGYHALSQAQWTQDLLQMCPDMDWHTIALPPRYFSWRMRGAPLSLSAQNKTTLQADYDLIVATSSIDLSVVQSIYPNLRLTPSILYFHENQFAYPKAHQPQSVVDWQMVNLYSALRADRLLFNSPFNQRSFFHGLSALLKKLPDLVPADLIAQLQAKAAVLPVPVQMPAETQQARSGVQNILWNHRWEWDKQPELLEAVIARCDAADLDVRFTVTGQQFRTAPDAFQRMQKQYSHRLHHMGFVEDAQQYRDSVAQCDVVLSTAVHEFQGVAVMEAVALGCTPLLPNDLSYPDYFPDTCLYDRQATLEDTAHVIVDRLRYWQQQGRPPAPDMRGFSREALTQSYQQQLYSMLGEP